MLGRSVFPVTNSIWCVRNRSYLNCSYIVHTGTGAVLIDAGMNSGGADVLAGLAALGLTAKSVEAILLTHWHNDHAAGARAIAQQSGCPVYYGKNDAPFLTRQTARSGVRGWLAKSIPEWGIGVLFIGLIGEAVPEAVEATCHVSDGQTIEQDFEVIATPGHTPGHASFYYRPEQALFAGDALAVIGDRVRFMARPVTPDLPLARESMLRSLNKEIKVLCPGHRIPLTENVPQRCAEMRAYLEAGGRWPFFG
jgi:glyoxylase-like metal-dependent hydrolase (beta-lactamase superfamily II)